MLKYNASLLEADAMSPFAPIMPKFPCGRAKQKMMLVADRTTIDSARVLDGTASGPLVSGIKPTQVLRTNRNRLICTSQASS